MPSGTHAGLAAVLSEMNEANKALCHHGGPLVHKTSGRTVKLPRPPLAGLGKVTAIVEAMGEREHLK